MAISNHERVGKALELLKAGLGPFIEREMKNAYGDRIRTRVAELIGEDRLLAGKAITEWDAAALIKLMWEAWHEVFRNTLGHAEKSLVSELREVRNQWAHQVPFRRASPGRRLSTAGC
jgi:hypothetical protein